jgi:transposase
MAKKAKTNKSTAIRDALAATPDKPVAEIAKSVGVSPALVYNVKAAMHEKVGKSKAKRGRKPGRKTASKKMAAPHAAHAALDSAFEFVTKVGGLLHAEELLAKLKSFKDKM